MSLKITLLNLQWKPSPMQRAEYSNIITYLKTGGIPNTLASTASNFKKKARKFTLHGDTLYKDSLPVVRWADRRRIFDEYHQHHRNLAHNTTLISDFPYITGGVKITGYNIGWVLEIEVAIKQCSWFAKDTIGLVDTIISQRKRESVWHAATKRQRSNFAGKITTIIWVGHLVYQP